MKTEVFPRLRECLAKLDIYLVIAMLLLLIYGVVVIWSTSPSLAQKQIIFILLGLPLFFLLSYLDYKIFSRIAPYLMLVTFILLVVTPLFGSEVRGTGRWFQIGSLTFQPSEVAKLALILGISWIYSLPNFSELKNRYLSFAIGCFLSISTII